MKVFVLLISVLLTINFSFTQEKLIKVLGQDLILLPATNNYLWRPEGNVKFHESNTYKGDTTGASNALEYLLFRDDLVHEPEKELFKLFSEDYVTNAKYREFSDWVLDSIFREMIFKNVNPTGENKISNEVLIKMLNYSDPYYNAKLDEWITIDLSMVQSYRAYFSFNPDFDWRKKIQPQEYIPIIYEMNLRPHERFNKAKEIDDRKLNYSFEHGTDKYVNISIDKSLWALNSIHDFDLAYNLANYYSLSSAFDNSPVTGINGNQIRAYLTFLELKYQKMINDAKLPYRLQISLPTEAEISEMDAKYSNESMKFISEEKDMTIHWRISNSDYKEFLMAVQDSLIREEIYQNEPSEGKELDNEDCSRFLEYEDVYFDEANIAWTEFDPSNTFTNRFLFNFDKDFNWRKKIDKDDIWRFIKYMVVDTLNTSIAKEDLAYNIFPFRCYYTYYWKDLNRAAFTDSLIWDKKAEFFISANNGKWMGRALALSDKNNEFWSGGVRRHEDYSRFIIKEKVNIYPGIECFDCNKICGNEIDDKDMSTVWPKVLELICPDAEEMKEVKEFYDFDTEPNALIQEITYTQALAYYNWKNNQRPLAQGENPIDSNLLPNEEEFKRIQNGETIVLPAQEVEYPTPVFRYVIHVFEK